MGQIHQVVDTKHQGKAEGEQRIHAAYNQTIEQLLGQHLSQTCLMATILRASWARRSRV
jgi:hypothetical protein